MSISRRHALGGVAPLFATAALYFSGQAKSAVRVAKSGQDPMMEIANIVTMRAPRGEEAALETALRKLVAATRTEPGNAACLLHRSPTNKDIFMVYERWRGQAGLDTHMKTAHVAEFLTKAEKLLAEPPEIRPFDFLL